MGDFVVALLRWTVNIPFVLASIFAFVVLFNLILSMTSVSINQSVLGDLFALVQMWLPFNLSVVLIWFTTATIAYIAFRVSIWAHNYVMRFLGGA